MWAALLLLACQRTPPAAGPPPTVRVATFNASLFRGVHGGLLADLADGDDPQAAGVAAILQAVRPDIVLLNEVDLCLPTPDPGPGCGDVGASVAALVSGFLAVSQGGRDPLPYPYTFTAPVNTGVASGLDLDRDGVVTTTPGTRAYGGDSWGFGLFPGQYGMAVLSRFPITAHRTFQHLRWAELPSPLWPDDKATPAPADWWPEDVRAQLRLSSKSHWDLTVDVGGAPLHVLASHPTPPVFDGPEDRNGRRNHDELRLWAEYLDDAAWITDDAGVAGGLGDARFVLLGDLNNDPFDGDGRHEAIRALLDHERVRRGFTPASGGALEAAIVQGRANDRHQGPPQFDTIDVENESVGNLRLDYVLPSADLAVVGGGVFWPRAGDADAALLGPPDRPVSDHHLVWVDVAAR